MNIRMIVKLLCKHCAHLRHQEQNFYKQFAVKF